MFVFASIIAKSQLCQGSLGDPVVNITFGAGSNPGAPLPAGVTDYTYVTTDCPNDGYYAIRNSTSNCFSNAWHNVTQDHTGNANGYFMLINAIRTPNDFYIDTVHGLCGNTIYEFAAWILNMILPANNIQNPNITFRIERTDGTVIDSSNTGDIPATTSVQWQHEGFYFTTPAGVTDVVLRMRNNTYGGANGNDLALDDITFRPCGPIVNIQSNTSPTNTNVCNGDSAYVNLAGSVNPSDANTAYQWQWSNDGGSTWQNIVGATTLNYDSIYLLSENEKYRLLSAANSTNITLSTCRVTSSPYTFSLVPNPAIKATSNSPVCVGDTVTLNATGGTTYNWTANNGTINTSTPEFKFEATDTSYSGTYYVLGTDNNNCKNTDSATVTINPTPIITLNNDTTICYGGSVNLTGNIKNDTGFYWLPTTDLINYNTLNPTATPTISTTYYLAATNQFNCNSKDSVTVTIVPPNRLPIITDTMIVANEPLQLNISNPGNYQFSWSPTFGMNDGNIPNPIITLNSSFDTVVYYLTVSKASCIVDTASIKVIVFKTQPDIFVPSAFTPNGDGKNDILKAIPVGIQQFDFLNLYNRWGQLIFTTTSADKGWDGTSNGLNQPSGTYIFITQGITYTGKKITKKGTIVLLR